MTRYQLLRISHIVSMLSAAVLNQLDWCKRKHKRFDRNTSIDCPNSEDQLVQSAHLLKKLPLEVVPNKSEYLEYIEDWPRVWNVFHTIRHLSECVSNEEEMAALREWLGDYGIRHSITETN